MRGLIFIFLLASCSGPVQYVDRVRTVHDTVIHEVPLYIECDTVHTTTTVHDTIAGECDSMAMRLRAARLKLNRVQYYVGICNRNPKQDKFLKGWINRALK